LVERQFGGVSSNIRLQKHPRGQLSPLQSFYLKLSNGEELAELRGRRDGTMEENEEALKPVVTNSKLRKKSSI
jgi:hypothetical protein